MRRTAQILALCCGLLLLVAADNARYEKLGSKIMCTCGCGQMLLKCNHVGCPNSDKMIRQLRAQVAQTTNDEDVLQFFRTEWGVTAVVEPATHGFELLVWVIPPVVVGFFLVLVIVVIRRWSRRAAAAGPVDMTLDPALEALRQRARKETEI